LKGVATIDLYITIYISISYTIFKAGAPIHIIIGTTGTGTHQGHSSLFYEATECHADLVIDSECKSLEVEASSIFTGRKFSRSEPSERRVVLGYMLREGRTKIDLDYFNTGYGKI